MHNVDIETTSHNVGELEKLFITELRGTVGGIFIKKKYEHSIVDLKNCCFRCRF